MSDPVLGDIVRLGCYNAESLLDSVFLVGCFHFSLSFSLVDENLLNFSFSFSHF